MMVTVSFVRSPTRSNTWPMQTPQPFDSCTALKSTTHLSELLHVGILMSVLTCLWASHLHGIDALWSIQYVLWWGFWLQVISSRNGTGFGTPLPWYVFKTGSGRHMGRRDNVKVLDRGVRVGKCLKPVVLTCRWSVTVNLITSNAENWFLQYQPEKVALLFYHL